MNWYLVATEEQELGCWKIVDDIPVWVLEIVPVGTIVNTIAYDGISPYIPPNGTELKSSVDVYNIGDMFPN